MQKISDDHEKSYARAVKKDQKKGTARHSADKWCTAAATELRECEAKYAQEMRTQAQRVLGQRTLMAQQYLIGLEAVKHTSAGPSDCSGLKGALLHSDHPAPHGGPQFCR